MENYELFDDIEPEVIIEVNKQPTDEINKSIKQRQNYFCSNIEKLVKEKKLTYLESIVYFCEKHDLPIEYVPKLINSSITDHLYEEGMELHFLKRVNQLPI